MHTEPDPAASPASPPSSTAIRIGGRADLREVLSLQRAAFTRVAREFGLRADELPPLTETLEDLEQLADEGSRFFLATVDEHPAGTVRARVRPDSIVEVGRLGVDDAYERRGLGSALMRYLEDSYPDADRFELFTGADAAAPLALYARLGYSEFSRQDLGAVTLVWLAKDR
jgi:ribosomal protein S18 acetylase RimI-like enzyme